MGYNYKIKAGSLWWKIHYRNYF